MAKYLVVTLKIGDSVSQFEFNCLPWKKLLARHKTVRFEGFIDLNCLIVEFRTLIFRFLVSYIIFEKIDLYIKIILK